MPKGIIVNLEMWTCPHCHREMGAYRKPRHAKACPMQPAIMACIAEVLPDPDNPEVAITSKEYKALCRGSSVLPSATILHRTWGEWSDVAHAFGLITWDEFKQRKGYGSLLPATIAELRRLSIDLYGGRIGPCMSDYKESMNLATGAQGIKAILRKAGTWEAALNIARLRLESPRFYWHARHWRKLGTTATNGASH